MSTSGKNTISCPEPAYWFEVKFLLKILGILTTRGEKDIFRSVSLGHS